MIDFGSLSSKVFQDANNPINIIKNTAAQVADQAHADANVAALDDLTSDLGDMHAGRFLALSTGSEPTALDATGAFISALGETFAGSVYHVGGVNKGKLQFGLSATDGSTQFSGGKIKCDQDGENITGWGQSLTLTNGYTIATISLGYGLSIVSYVLSGSNLVSNGDFETGDLTGWTPYGTGIAEVISTDFHTGSYCYRGRSVGGSGNSTYSGFINVTAGKWYLFEIFGKNVTDPPIDPRYSAGRVSCIFYDSGGNPLGYGMGGMDIVDYSWSHYASCFLVPAGAAKVKVEIDSLGYGGRSVCVDDVSLKLLAGQPITFYLYPSVDNINASLGSLSTNFEARKIAAFPESVFDFTENAMPDGTIIGEQFMLYGNQAPTTPTFTGTYLYRKADKKLYYKSEDGVENLISTGAGGSGSAINSDVRSWMGI
jgi:hypothetical protein